LSKYPVQSIKIDQSFIHGIHENHNLAITRAIVNLSKELDMTVIAEGIETKEQLDILKELNVDLIQGFYFAKPQSLDDFIANYKS
jgi:EAL domain-containing protein (putative c-di-GMP-specific phosphodiesterase class I)